MQHSHLARSFAAAYCWAAFLTVVAIVVCGIPARAWGPEGHRMIAIIAAQHLSSSAQDGVRTLLASDPLAKDILSASKDLSALAEAMAAVANWADAVKQKTGTQEWHFLDLASADQHAQLAERCPGGECVTEKIKVMAPNLKPGTSFPHDPTPFTPTEQLKFIIHLMGDLHQPLHCATNADAGGNCLRTAGFKTPELHAAWDGGMIRVILLKGTDEDTLARDLNTRFATKFDAIVSMTDPDEMALQSHGLAFQTAYGPLLDKHLLPGEEPRAFLRLKPQECATKAPDFFAINPHPNLTKLYSNDTFDTVRQQLATAGYRLATLLNTAFN